MKIYFLSLLLTTSILLCAACAQTAEPAPRVQDTPIAPAMPTPATPVVELEAPMSEQLTLEYRACEADADCALALKGCRDCANGGRDSR